MSLNCWDYIRLFLILLTLQPPQLTLPLLLIILLLIATACLAAIIDTAAAAPDPTANYHYCYENNSSECKMTRIQVYSYPQVSLKRLEHSSRFRNEQHNPCAIILADWCVQLSEQKKSVKDWVKIKSDERVSIKGNIRKIDFLSADIVGSLPNSSTAVLSRIMIRWNIRIPTSGTFLEREKRIRKKLEGPVETALQLPSDSILRLTNSGWR